MGKVRDASLQVLREWRDVAGKLQRHAHLVRRNRLAGARIEAASPGAM